MQNDLQVKDNSLTKNEKFTYLILILEVKFLSSQKSILKNFNAHQKENFMRLTPVYHILTVVFSELCL